MQATFLVLPDCPLGVILILPKDLQAPPQRAKMGAVLNNDLGRNHEENTCHLAAGATGCGVWSRWESQSPLLGHQVRNKYIIYVCPTGGLANRLTTYFTRSSEVCGPNGAHKYMPHCSLTGFFEHEDKDVDRWKKIIQNVLSVMIANMPKPPVRIMDIDKRLNPR